MLYIFISLIALSLGGIVFLAKKRNLLKLRGSSVAKNNDVVEGGDSAKLASSNFSEERLISLINKDPHNVEHYKKLGEWYAKNNKKEYAAKTLEYAAKLDTKNKKLKKKLAELQS